MGSKMKIGNWLTSARNKQITNMGKDNIISKGRTWPRLSALITMPKGILHEIALNQKRYLAILKLANFV